MSLLKKGDGLQLLAWALLVAVTALSSVAFFADRVQSSLEAQGSALLAADLVVEQKRPIPGEWVAEATRRNLQHSLLMTFPSVLFINDTPQLVQIKAVDDNYPLRGQLKISHNDNISHRGPAPGTAWGAQTLLDHIADRKQPTLPLGELQLQLSGVIIEEPDRGDNLFQLAPRLMVHINDAQRSGLLGPASRISHRLLVAGDARQLADYRRWLKSRLDNNAQLLNMDNARPELRSALQRGQRFLSLAALCASLLAGVAIMLASRRFVQQALDESAILRTLGMTSGQLLLRYLRRLLLLTLLAALIGVALGYIGQLFLTGLMSELIREQLPAPGWRPVPLAIAHALILVLGFAVPSLMAIRQVPPLRVLRRELKPPGLSQGLTWLLALSAFVGLIHWQVNDALLAWSMSLGVIALLFIFVVVGWLLLRMLRPLSGGAGNVSFGLAALTRHPELTLLQLAGFGLGASLLLLLALVRVEILDAWQNSLPPETPNHFMINIQPDEAAGVRQLFRQHGITDSGLFATTRARLLKIDDQAVDPTSYDSSRARRLAAREYSLGFSAQMQNDNRLLQGEWWSVGQNGFSIEQSLAEALKLQVGNRLTFDIAGQQISAPVRSIRQVKWDSFNVNFFVVGNTALLQGIPHAVITSIYIEEAKPELMRQLATEFPAVSVINIGPLMEQVRGIIARGALAIEGVFVFTLLAAVLVTLAAVQISREQRAREVAILRTLGASRRRVLVAALAEFGLLGLLAGALAALLANVLNILLADQLFNLATGFNTRLWLIGCLGSIAVVVLVGYLATRPVLRTPPMHLLK